jgi:hypothetical protein
MLRRFLVLPAAAALLAMSIGAANAASTSWTFEPVPQPQGGFDLTPSAVSCPSADDCITVGSADDAGAVAESWDGTAWSVMPIPQPPNENFVTLNAVSCVSDDYCMAVGQDEAAGGKHTGQTLTELWNGSAWTIEPTPLPFKSQQTHVLESVSCTSADYCVAAGLDFINSKKGYYWFIDQWNGSAWTVEATVPGFLEFGSTGISCPTTAGCYLTDSDQVAYWSGGDSVTTTDLATPAGTSDMSADGISCTSTESCTAVGSVRDAADTDQPVAEYWDGTSWEIQPTHLPAKGVAGGLTAVSCTSAAYCTAVGSYDKDPSATQYPLTERWTPNTPGQWGIPHVVGLPEDYSLLSGVSCTTTVNCAGVGNYYDDGTQGLSEVLAPIS